MTEEEIKNLKAGDKFTVSYLVEGVNSTSVYALDANGSRLEFNKLSGGTLPISTLVKPAPTFEVGDTVRIVPDPLTGGVYGNGYDKEDCRDEVGKIILPLSEGDLKVETNQGETEWISIHCLELVKKAARDKYRLVECDEEWQIVDESGNYIAGFGTLLHPDAAAAARAECCRLIKAWRDKQNN